MQNHSIITFKVKFKSVIISYCYFIVVREFDFNDIKTATGNFSDLSIIGEGGFGTVYLGIHKGTKVAIKIFTEVRT